MLNDQYEQENALISSHPPTKRGNKIKSESGNISTKKRISVQNESSVDATKSQRYNYSYPSAPFNKRLQYYSNINSCFEVFGAFFVLHLIFLFFASITPLLIVFIPIIIVIRKLHNLFDVFWCHKVCPCRQMYLLNHQERFWLANLNECQVVQVLVYFTSGLDFYQIRNILASRLVFAECCRGKQLYPRFTQKLIELRSGFAWMQDDRFNLDNHIVSMPDVIKNEANLKAHIAALASTPLDLKFSPWQIQVCCNFGSTGDSVLLFRMHPCFANGMTLSYLLVQQLADRKDQEIFWQFYTYQIYIINAVRTFLILPFVFLMKWIFNRSDYYLSRCWGSSSTEDSCNDVVVSWSEDFPLPVMRRIKSITRTTVNDILFSVLAGVLRSHFQKHGIIHPRDCKILFPVNLHMSSTDFSLRYNLVEFELPVNVEGIIPRLWETKQRMINLKNNAEPVVMNSISWLSSILLPLSLQRRLYGFFHRKYLAYVSNTPGSDHEIEICSKSVKRIIYWSSILHKRSPTFSFYTFNNKLTMSVVCLKSVIENPEDLAADFILEMEKLSSLLRFRRDPLLRQIRNECVCHFYPVLENITVLQVERRLCEIQKQLLAVRKIQLSMTKSEMSEDEAFSTCESLKCEFKHLLSELRRLKFEKKAAYFSDEEEERVVCSQANRRRSSRLSLSNLYNTASGHSSSAIEEETLSGQPFASNAPCSSVSLKKESVIKIASLMSTDTKANS